MNFCTAPHEWPWAQLTWLELLLVVLVSYLIGLGIGVAGTRWFIR